VAQFSFKEVAPCLFAIFIDILGFGLVAPLAVALFTSPESNVFGITTASVSYLCLGITLALYPLLMFFGTSFIGDLSDIIGRKKTLLISMIGLAFSFLLMGLGIITASLTLFLFGRGLSGLVSASQSVALATISDLSTKENKAVHLSYVALMQCFGFVAGPLIGGILSGMAFYTPFFGAALFAFLGYLWILVDFKETFTKKSDKKISFVRFLKVFVEAYHNDRIRSLSVIFLLMQIGVGFYLPIILIYLSTQFQYTSVSLGIFNAYLGVAFAISLIFVLPRMLKRFKIEEIVCLSLATTFFAQFFTSIIHTQSLVWILAFPYALAAQLAFTGMFTSFSNATDARSQGWVMGISVAVMAVAWAVAGFSAQLVPLIGAPILIFIGSLFIALSALLMKRYCSTHPI
jgi:MFS family permease